MALSTFQNFYNQVSGFDRASYNKPVKSAKKPTCTAPSFQGKMVNGHYYTDQVYVDAMTYKSRGSVNFADFRERYSLRKYLFTSKPEEHAEAVNKCIRDIKYIENLERQEKIKKQQAYDKEMRAVQMRILVNNIKKIWRELKINVYANINENSGLSSDKIGKTNKELLVNDFLQPFAENMVDQADFLDVPNGILISGKNSSERESVVHALAEQMRIEAGSDNFKKIEFYGNVKGFQNMLTEAKKSASQKFSNDKSCSIIYIPGFDKIALKHNNPMYNPNLNGFLKVFILDCAQNGVFVLGTAEDKNKIESPFLTNSRRFGVSIDLDDED